MNSRGSNRALVLAGAVAKGAFEAGVLSVLAEEEGITFARVVGTSAGALNAAVMAAGIAVDRERQAAANIEALWRNRASVTSFFVPQLRPWRGLSSTARVQAVVREALANVVGDRAGDVRADVKLTLVMTDLQGTIRGGHVTHEAVATFRADDLANPDRWPKIAEAAAASATFPLMFTPTLVGGRPQVDGGAVNNAPISYAIDQGATQIFAVVAAPDAPAPTAGDATSFTLAGRLADVLINERISRDLVVAKKRNVALRKLEAELARQRATREEQQAIRATLGWRELDIVEIRPRKYLPGNALLGFLSARVRASYVDEGYAAARETLSDRRIRETRAATQASAPVSR